MGLLDGIALFFFFGAWVLYSRHVDRSRLRGRGISAAMTWWRRRWMRQVMRRDGRIVDASILNTLNTSIGFFASSTILVIGGLIALLGALRDMAMVLNRLSLLSRTSPLLLEIKITVLLAIFIYAFFKFAWAYQLGNYCAIIVGAFPPHTTGTLGPETRRNIAQAASLNRLLGLHFNRGLRAYFFGLAFLGWFVHPVLLILLTVVVICVIYRREFCSDAAKILRPRSRKVKEAYLGPRPRSPD